MSAYAHASKTGVRLYRRIAASFVIATVLLLGFVLSTTISRAKIIITAKPVPVNVDLKVAVAGETKTSETVRGHVILTIVEGTSTGKPEGAGTVVHERATGTVMLINKRSTSQQLVATTRLLTPEGILFRIKENVEIPANGELGDVPVYADVPGPTGEIGSSNFTIPGLNPSLQKLVYAFSEKPMTGGLVTVKLITESDITKAVETLTSNLTDGTTRSLRKTMEEKGFTGIESSATETSRIVSAKAGDRAAEFTVQLKLTVNAVLYDREKLNNLGSEALRANLGPDMTLTSDTVSFTVTVEGANVKAQTATLAAAFTGTAKLNDRSSLLHKDRLVGLDQETVRTYLRSFEAVSNAEAKFSPFWVRRVPRAHDRILIIIE